MNECMNLFVSGVKYKVDWTPRKVEPSLTGALNSKQL